MPYRMNPFTGEPELYGGGGGGSGVTNFTTDSGGVTPIGGNVNVFGGDNINTEGNVDTITVNLNPTILQPDGTASDPSYSFASRPGDGLYNDSNQSVMSWGGNDVVKFGFTTQVVNTLELFGALAINHGSTSTSSGPQGIWTSVNTSGGPVTITLPASPRDGQVFYIKDSAGTAATNNITIQVSGGVKTMDGQTSYIIAVNYACVMLLYNGTNYEVG